MKLFMLPILLVLPLLMPFSASAFEPEKLGQVRLLPEAFPEHWLLVRDFGALAMSLEGRILLVDPLGESVADQFKGLMTASLHAGFAHSIKRNEFYVIETFYSRGGRTGDRTDLVTIWDQQTLTVIDEIPIPAGRLTGIPKRTSSGLIGDDRFLAIYRFTPAQTVSIIDLDKRELVTQVALSGCALVLPNGEHSFTSICGDGSLRTSHLDTSGMLKNVSTSDVLFDPMNDPIFSTPALVNGVAYFVTFSGQVLPVNIDQDVITAGQSWPLAQNSEEASWRPGGLSMLIEDSAGFGYVLMHPDGKEGTHDNGGSEVWVYDFANQKRLRRFELKTWALSLGTSGGGDQRFLFAMNSARKIDMYQIPSGDYVKTLDLEVFAPLQFHGLQR